MRVAALALLGLSLTAPRPAMAQSTVDRVDVALVLAVDISGSVDENRFSLQMEGIARAFEDHDVQSTILSGQYGAVLVTLVNWSQKPQMAVPWRVIASSTDAMAFAADVRRAPRRAEDFTCMSLMMQVIGEKVLPLMPVPAVRRVVDISGDGRDNCNPRTAVDSERDGLVADRVTINGLPIREGREAETIAQWYEQHVIGGPAAFLLPANGYQDFGRAIRQKFIIEISGRQPRFAPSVASR
ncbi:MAG TPA: DUF1194 domain-containing protein [Candidatus Angelobacter sp.]|nr:DUF1194 domain-containing protein [Candidatus Angelobacter sp.]